MKVIELNKNRACETVEYTESQLYDLYITILSTTPENSNRLFRLYFEWNGYDIFEKFRSDREKEINDIYRQMAKGYMNMDINRLVGFA